ncbi:MAG: bifunctional oligoribonuclease/PAP phosphatase NrnA, partial [Clostridia bacterium]|nr:bifunctional oligoribonuclease/PAP phosphatase NrnA [Clostridia bacterium]
INRMMFDTKSKERVELEKMVLETADFLYDDRCLVLTVTSEMHSKSGCHPSDLDGVASISRSVEGVLIGVSIKQSEEDTYKISLRTYEPFNASEICKTLGGGGHKAAAGCTLTGSLSEVKKQIIDAVGKAIEENDTRAIVTE